VKATNTIIHFPSLAPIMATADEPLWNLRNTTDPLTYLTYIETNLTKEKLPILHEVLAADDELTDTIGWDLVATLIPLLPESATCLLRVAKKGSPKEVVLKVTEALRRLDFEDPEDDADEESGAAAEEEPKGQSNGNNLEDLSLAILQFQSLVQMLGILHPRIKAKAPSRFLSASLQAILAAFVSASSHHDILTLEIVKFIKTLTGTKRPQFPPRRTSSQVLLSTLSSKPPAFGPVPPSSESPESEEDRIHRKLLQSFLTHTLDDYMQSLQPYDDILGLAWCSRYWEEIKHPYLVPSKVSVTDRFSNSAELEVRLTTVGQLVAVAQDLEIHSDDLIATILDPTPEEEGDRTQEQDSPSSAESIPLSKDGALYLYTARKAMEVLYGGASITDDIPIFPGHAHMARVFIENLGEDGLRAMPEPLLDALLFHGLIALEMKNIGDPQSDDQFASYLQSVSLVSAAVPSPTIRFHAHYLTTAVLRSHPKDVTRFAYIRDTLEHCPFESLKASAVSWIKDETVAANKPVTGNGKQAADANALAAVEDDTLSLFASPIPLSTLCSDLWPDLSAEYNFSTSDSSPDTTTAIEEPQQAYFLLLANYGFYAATLNFLLLLLRSQYLHANLNIKSLLEEGEILKNFVHPLRDAAAHYETLSKLEGDDEPADSAGGVMELNLLKMLTSDVGEEVKKLGWFVEEPSL
jgi:hypothetical protein